MRRHDNWPALLAGFIEERRAMPFAWGSNDCCLFAADWVRRACGVDFADGLRGTYFSALGASRVLAKFGGILSVAEARAGMASAPLAKVQRGDLVAFPMQRGHALGICLGDVSALVGRAGLIFPRTESASAAWRL